MHGNVERYACRRVRRRSSVLVSRAFAGADHAVMVGQFEWWFGGGADAAIAERFAPVLERAARGELDHWSYSPRSRLALIIVLDQFSRSIHRGTARAFAQDQKALDLALRGHRDRSLRGPRDAVGENVLLPAFGALRGAHASGDGGQARRGARGTGDQQSSAGSWSTRRRRRVAIATSSPASAAILIATPSWGGNRRPKSSTTWPAASSCIRGRCRTDPRTFAGPFEIGALVTCCARTIPRWRACSSRSRPG